ncbi:MAG: transcriptional regulator [Pseudonocardiaceae bacterium]|nr:transcriptional regulator [Pseudonocardiaceae bacterium]
MARRYYGQYCGLAHAVDLVGERWALLIVRDLLVSPKRFTDLKRGLPRIPTNVLSARLKELEGAGVVRRHVLPRPDGSVVYELTDYGNELEDIVLALGRWGARTLGEPGADDIVTADALIMAMRSTFRPEAARDMTASYELRVGDVVIHVRVDDGDLEVAEGGLPDAGLVIETGPAIKALMAGELGPEQAIADGQVALTGPADLLHRFVQTFRI